MKAETNRTSSRSSSGYIPTNGPYRHTSRSGGPDFDVFANAATTGRKTWKTLKDKKEAVWPPLIEKALLEALEKYRPTSTRDVTQLQRFPKRNRFISEYILKHTGTHRTAKQVGSRLQQLRDTCSEEHVLNLLTRRDLLKSASDLSLQDENHHERTINLYDDSDSRTASSIASTSPAPQLTPDFPPGLLLPSEHNFGTHYDYEYDSSPPPHTPIRPATYVVIDLIQPGGQQPTDTSSTVLPPLSLDWMPSHDVWAEYDAPCCRMPVAAQPSFWRYPPTVTLTSSTRLLTSDFRSRFRVFRDNIYIHSEITDISSYQHKASDSDLYVYAAQLIPQYWATLFKNTGQDLSRCTIELDVLKVGNGGAIEEVPVFSAVFDFNRELPNERPIQAYQPALYQSAILPSETPIHSFPEVPLDTTPYPPSAAMHSAGGWSSPTSESQVDISNIDNPDLNSFSWIYPESNASASTPTLFQSVPQSTYAGSTIPLCGPSMHTTSYADLVYHPPFYQSTT